MIAEYGCEFGGGQPTQSFITRTLSRESVTKRIYIAMMTVHLREVEEDDLAEFYEHQREPLAIQMAAFPPRDRDTFMAHWKKILADDQVIARTIVSQARVAGNVLCFQQSGKWFVGYWLGSYFWGQGIATQALSAFVVSVAARPLNAYVAKGNVGSIRVLEKCGFALSGESRAAAPTGGEAIDEFIYTLFDRQALDGASRGGASQPENGGEYDPSSRH